MDRSTTRWLKLELAVAEEAADPAGDVLLELGAPGYEVQDVQTFFPSRPGAVTLVAYLPDQAGLPEQLQLQTVQKLRARLAAPGRSELGVLLGLRVQAVDDPGWAEAWKRFFRPIPVGQRLLVRPPWEPIPGGEQRAVLTLDPGLAFGTGNHPSTRLCLELIEELAPPRSMLDVGCGSGILTIAAALLGTAHAMGIDIDEEAVRVARANAVLNDVPERTEFSTCPLEEVRESFPLVVANIISGTLIRLAPQLVQRVQDDGRLLLAGILAPEAETVLQAFRKLDMELVLQRDGRDDGGELWSALLLAGRG
ncbi:MAG: 50S ribosomal protein L11 methyltransferase [Deltaproteobacteria bacterium]|nr:50S ribosomal protein L11 methyltransferase [Deltaproteobacteria bacterium]